MTDQDSASQDRQEKDKPHVPINERSQSIDEFCIVEGFSRSTFNKLRRLNLAPEITEIVGPSLSLQRITPESRREWHVRMKAYRESKEAQIAAERRHQHLLAAGQKSTQSANHISKRQKRKRRSRAQSDS